jgi:hypothetical protein
MPSKRELDEEIGEGIAEVIGVTAKEVWKLVIGVNPLNHAQDVVDQWNKDSNKATFVLKKIDKRVLPSSGKWIRQDTVSFCEISEKKID